MHSSRRQANSPVVTLLRSFAVVICSSALWAQAASPSPQATDYFRVRDAAQVQDTYTAEEIRTRPDSFAGKLLEVRGVVEGLVESGPAARITLRSEETAVTTVALPPGKALSDWPFVTVGSAVRLLCRVVTAEGDRTGSLEFVIVVSEAGAASAERRRIARNLGLSRSEPIEKSYSSAVRYFNEKLTQKEADLTAAEVLKQSREKGLDARLVMAVMDVEKSFEVTKGRPKPGFIASLAASVRDGIGRYARDGHITEDVIRKALALRSASTAVRKRIRPVTPREYPQRVIKLYRQMCGLEF